MLLLGLLIKRLSRLYTYIIDFRRLSKNKARAKYFLESFTLLASFAGRMSLGLAIYSLFIFFYVAFVKENSFFFFVSQKAEKGFAAAARKSLSLRDGVIVFHVYYIRKIKQLLMVGAGNVSVRYYTLSST